MGQDLFVTDRFIFVIATLSNPYHSGLSFAFKQTFMIELKNAFWNVSEMHACVNYLYV